MSFGRKGLQQGQAASQPTSGFGRAAQSSAAAAPNDRVENDLAAKRAAFIASERARKQTEIGGGSLPDANGDYSDDPMAHLRNETRPAKPVAAIQAHNSSAPAQMAATSRPKPAEKKWVFGPPHKRSIFVAYVLWYFASLGSVHRFYCGSSETAWYQIGMFFGGIIVLLIYPPLGLAVFVGWLLWIVADLFLMPGMMRRFKAQYPEVDTRIFE